VMKKDVEQAVDILSDILQNSSISNEAVEHERHVILKEMEEVNQQFEEVIFDRLHETAYQNHPLSKTILGPAENIRSIKQEDILEYKMANYTAPRMVLAGAGAVDHQELVKLASRLFRGVPSNPPPGKRVVAREPARFTGSSLLVRDDALELAHIAFAFPTAGWVDADNYPLMLIQTMLGSWERSSAGGSHSSSNMISGIASKDLANSVTTFNTQYSDTGLFGVYAVVEPFCQRELFAVITRELTSFCYSVDPHKLAEAKNQLKLNLLSSLDGSTLVAEDIGRQLLTYNRRLPPWEVLQRIDAVDVDAIQTCANRFFFDVDLAIAAIGNTHELPDYNWFRGRTHRIAT